MVCRRLSGAWRVARALSLPALLAGYVAAFLLFLAPYQGSIDSHYFKDAGVSLALGQGFVSTFNFGNPTAEPLLYAGYPPLYPLLYGLYASVAGVGPASNTAFELLLAALTAWLLARALRPALPGGLAPALLVAALALAALALRYTNLLLDRPDSLALLFALGATQIDLGRRRGVLLAGGLAGLALATSLFGGLLAVAGVALRWGLATERLPFWRTCALALLPCLLPLLLAVLVLQTLDATYLDRLFGFVSYGTAPAVAAALGEPGGWLDAFLGARRESASRIGGALPLIALLAATAMLAGAPGLPARRRRAALAGIWLFALLAIALVPWTLNYGAMTAGLLSPALAMAMPRAAWTPRRRAALIAGLALVLVCRAAVEAPTLIAQAGMRPSLERMEAVLRELRPSDRNGDGEVWFVADSLAYFLLRPRGYRILTLESWVVADADRQALGDYFVFGYGGGGDPLRARQPPWWPAMERAAELLYRPALPQRPTLWGLAVTGSSRTWEMEVWARRTP